MHVAKTMQTKSFIKHNLFIFAFQIELELHKDGTKLGFSVVGGIDQDSSKNPFIKNDQVILSFLT